ncbi:MAG: hypothetical protein NT013_19970, partial [Planctomycetia bacterium]|nr:hypothetical protein [Planctomycetia bacterium]
YDTGSASATIGYTGLEPVDMIGSTITDLVFNLPAGSANDFNLEDDGNLANGLSRIVSNGGLFETTVFANPTGSLTINAGGLGDYFNFYRLDNSFTAPVTFTGGAGADRMYFHTAAATNIVPAGGVNFVGSGNNDGFAIFAGYAATNVDYSFTNQTDGTITIDGKVISFDDISVAVGGFDLLVSTNRSFQFAGTNDTITFGDDAVGNDNVDRVQSTASSIVVDFISPTNSLFLKGGGGDDNITIGSNAGIDAQFVASVTVDGEADIDSITLVAGLPTISALTTTSDYITPLPALTIGAGGLSITSSAGSIVVNGSLTVGGSLLLDSLMGDNVFVNSGAAVTAADVTLKAKHDVNLASSVSGTNGISVTDTVGDFLLLNGGSLTSTAGNLVISASGAITGTAGAVTIFGTTTLTAGSTRDIALDNTGNDFTGAVSIVSGSDVSLRDDNTGFILGATNVSTRLTVNSDDTITQTSPITGAGGLTKQGVGTFILDQTNTYLGTTLVSAGVLAVNGSITSDVTVDPSGTLHGIGTITGNVIGAGSLSPGNSPGNSPGVMTINGDFAPTGTVNFEVNSTYAVAGSDYDQYVINGTVDLSGATLTFTNNVVGTPANGTIVTLINNTSANPTTGSASPANGTTVLGGDFKIFYDGGTGNEVVLNEAFAPSVSSVTANDTSITDSDTPGAGTFTVTVVFDESMDTTATPTLTFA